MDLHPPQQKTLNIPIINLLDPIFSPTSQTSPEFSTNKNGLKPFSWWRSDRPCFGETYGCTPSCTVIYSWNSCWLLCYPHVLKIQTKTDQMYSTPRRSTLVTFIRWNQHIFKMKLQNPEKTLKLIHLILDCYTVTPPENQQLAPEHGPLEKESPNLETIIFRGIFVWLSGV